MRVDKILGKNIAEKDFLLVVLQKKLFNGSL